jgi:lysophospholipase L1-like esterase
MQAANAVLATAAQTCGARVADVFTAFDGKNGLFLYYRNGADPNEGHPTNAGYRVMAKAFEDAANQ